MGNNINSEDESNSTTNYSLVIKFLLNRWWWLFPNLLLAILLSWSLWLNISSVSKHHNDIARESARNTIKMIQVTRLWNARHGGVYVPVTENTRPNPYLEVPHRDILTVDNKRLTLINPAFMTRQIAELSEEVGNSSFHITSLNPIRPANKADAWETAALKRFELGDKETFERISDHDSDIFRFMVPLVVKKSCLKCHEKQGYELGDIRGGISTSFHAVEIISGHDDSIYNLILLHLIVFVLISLLVVLFFEAMRRKWLALKHVEESQQEIIKERTKELEHLATHDPLTGLFNRNVLEKRIAEELFRSDRYKHSLSIFILDIDFFKKVNDNYGHQSGDTILCSFANLLQSSLRKTDFVARFGGEEFIVILPETESNIAETLAENLRLKVMAYDYVLYDGSSINITTSIGVASYPDHAGDWEELLEKADMALYRAKDNGRNQVQIAKSS